MPWALNAGRVLKQQVAAISPSKLPTTDSSLPTNQERQTTLAIVCLVSDGLTFEKRGPSEAREYIPQWRSLQGFLRTLGRLATTVTILRSTLRVAHRKCKLGLGRSSASLLRCQRLVVAFFLDRNDHMKSAEPREQDTVDSLTGQEYLNLKDTTRQLGFWRQRAIMYGKLRRIIAGAFQSESHRRL